jgi:hypothetical protein
MVCWRMGDHGRGPAHGCSGMNTLSSIPAVHVPRAGGEKARVQTTHEQVDGESSGEKGLEQHPDGRVRRLNF